MAVVKMDKMTVVGLSADRKDIVDALMRLGAVEIIENGCQNNDDTSRTAVGDPGTTVSAEQSIPVNALSRLEMAIQNAGRLIPQKKAMFSGRRSVDAEAFLEIAARESVILDQVGRFEHNKTRQNELQTQLTRLFSLSELLEPWKNLTVDLSSDGTEHVRIFLGSLATVDLKEQIMAQLAEEAPETLIEVLAADEGGLRCVIATWRPRTALVQAILRRSGFNPLPVQSEAGTPDQQLDRLHNRISEMQTELVKLKEEELVLAGNAADFEMLHDFLLIHSDRLQVEAALPKTHSTFWLQGWVPAHLTGQVKKGLESRFLVALDARPAAADEEYPILFRNNPLVKPYEVIVEMFSPPSTREIDPTPLVAPFYFFFFGMMLSDIGYGLALTAICAFIAFKAKAGGEMGRLSRMLFLCGISSTIWGFLFGGFFGDMLSVLTDQRVNIPALWFNPMDDATKLMIWSMIFGVVHLFVGMGAKIYLLFLTGHGKDALLDIAPWYLIIGGIGLMVGGIGGSAGMILALTGAGIIVLFGGRDAHNPIMRLAKGLIALYGITGYFSDILSYTRILALVLATSVIAMVVNLLGFLGGPTIPGFLIFIVAAVAGHSLNLALSSLSAFVHTSRLHYVEFFGKFYEGGGRIWRPLKLRTRYVEICRPAVPGPGRPQSRLAE
ncbi:MAG: V-type ATP synthase subunit I [Clostridiaceae bacterium]|nr:V-type ATP synthase subunit I [Clostridiaceae bacterium]